MESAISQSDEAAETLSNKVERPHSSPNGASDEVFHYQSLDQSVKDSFRLATLLPGPQNAQPHLALSDSTWQNGEALYEALSYTWGDQHITKTIILNGSNFEVTENLYSALTHLRFEDRSRVLWIDAICIDQTSVKERNHQVASMAEIYENCQKVLVWLGDEDEETEFLATFIPTATKEIQEGLSNERYLRSSDGILDFFSDEILAKVIDRLFRLDLVVGWKYFFRVLQRKWWSRAWVVQEFAIAPDVTFYIGNFLFDWVSIFLLVITLSTGERLLRLLHLRLVEGKFFVINRANDICYNRLVRKYWRYCDTPQQTMSQRGYRFLGFLRGQCNRNCSDPRDKVYSILSMGDESTRQVFHPNYSKSVRSVYIATVKAYVSIFSNLNILAYNAHKSSPDYPSWCPDWSKSKTHQLLNVIAYEASATTTPETNFSEDESTMYVKGFYAATVIEDCVQNSPLKLTDQVALSWDLRLMARKIQDLGFRDMETGSEYETCAISLAQTLVAAYWGNSNGQKGECPPPATDPATREWWLGEDKRKFNLNAYKAACDRTVIFCDDKRIGLAPSGTRVGDEIWIFLGAATPFIIRRIDEEGYKFIGSCYVHGIMKGEAMEDLEKGKYELKQVAIR